jgi:PhzF family phenazine biosynthesis protein
LQNIASENNLSETAFLVKNGKDYDLRWFTPVSEIDLCGHATLASAFVILNFYEKNNNSVVFKSKSGDLPVKKDGDMYTMNLPSFNLKQVAVTEQMEKAIGFKPLEAWMARDLVCVMESEDVVKKIKIDLNEALKLDGLLLQITAKGSKYDCVSRTFAPKLGINEDPVCGSGHCHITPLWSEKLKKNDIVARQASSRGGILYCKNNGDRIEIGGKLQLYLEGEIHS